MNEVMQTTEAKIYMYTQAYKLRMGVLWGCSPSVTQFFFGNR